jgi:hypothetical protein
MAESTTKAQTAEEKPVAVAKATTPEEEEVQRIHDERMKNADKHAAMAARTAAKAAAAQFRPVKADE